MSLLQRSLFSLLTAGLLLLPTGAFAADDDLDFEGDDDLEDDEEGEAVADDEVDDEAIYKEYKDELRGEGPSEEIDAWNRYLDVYTKSLYRLEIEKRVKALEEAAYQETLEERLAVDEAETVDAKDLEMKFLEPALMSLSPNTRRHIEVGALWGFASWLNFEALVEWNFHRQFSVWGGVRHAGKDIGGAVQIGAKGAFIKDVRTGVLMSGMFNIEAGAGPKTGFFFAIQPTYGFGFKPNDFFQIQTTLGLRLRLNGFRSEVLWDVQAAVSPNEIVSIYVESLQKHSLYSPPVGDVQYFGFHQAGVGVKLRPVPMIEVTVGVNVPYALRLWRDYQYAGVHFDFVVYLPGQPKERGTGEAGSGPFGS